MMSSEKQMITLRRYESSDLSSVVRLHHRGLEQDGVDAGPGPWDDDLADIKGHYIENGGEFLVGLCDNRLVGMGAIRRIDAKSGEIKRMRVHPDYQGRGYGQAILSKLEDRARDLGFESLVLDTTSRQLKAQALYKKNGYVESRRTPQGAFELIFFRKDLGFMPGTPAAPST